MTDAAAGTARTVLAIDVGGTGIKAALIDGDGAVVRRLERATPAAEGPQAVVAAVRAVAAELADRSVAAVGAVVPGAVDVSAGIARYSANLGWRDVPLRDLLIADLGLPVTVEHDVRAAGWAEVVLGRARDVADCLIMIIGTGIAGVVRSGATMLRGAGDLAGEIGHVPVYPDGDICACGMVGCLETYASAAAVARRYQARSGRVRDARAVAAARESDPVAGEVWQEATQALALALTTYTMLLDPAAIVLGGGLAEAGEALLAPVRGELSRRLVWRPAPPVEVSPLGARAGQLGAALLAWQSIGRTGFETWSV